MSNMNFKDIDNIIKHLYIHKHSGLLYNSYVLITVDDNYVQLYVTSLSDTVIDTITEFSNYKDLKLDPITNMYNEFF